MKVMQYNIIHYAKKNTVEAMNDYINLDILCIWTRQDIEWIMNNCDEDVTSYEYRSCLVRILAYLYGFRATINNDHVLYETIQQLTCDELRRIHEDNNIIILLDDKIIRRYIDIGCHDIIPEDYITNNVEILMDMEKLGIPINYEAIVLHVNDINAYIIEKAIKLNIITDIIRFRATPYTLLEVMKYVNKDKIWRMFYYCVEEDMPCTTFYDILYENGITNNPGIEYYMSYNRSWGLEHLHYFDMSDILIHYISYDKIPPSYIDALDYSNVIVDENIYLTSHSLAKIYNLKNPLRCNRYIVNRDTLRQVNIKLILYVSTLKNVRILEQDVSVVDAIRLLYYIPTLSIKIIRPSNTLDIKDASDMYKEGYNTLCRRYSHINTVKYIMGIVGHNNHVPTYHQLYSDVNILTL